MLRNAIAIALALSPLARAGGDLFVVDQAGGPGTDFTSLETAVDAVPAGSTLLVRSGQYERLQPHGALVVQADAGAVVEIEDVFLVDVVDPGGVTIRGVTITTPALVHECAAPIWFEDCALPMAGVPVAGFTPPGPALTVERSPSVVLIRCSLSVAPTDCGALCFASTPGGIGLQVESSTVHLYDTDVSGGEGSFVPGSAPEGSAGGDAVLVLGGSLYASGGSFRGGLGSIGAADSGCVVVETPGPGGHGLHLAGPTPARALLAGVHVEGGSQGLPFTPGGLACADFEPVTAAAIQAPAGAVALAADPAPSFEAVSPTDQALHATLAGAGGGLALLGVGTAQEIGNAHGLDGALLLGLPFHALPLGVVPFDPHHFDLDLPGVPAGTTLYAQPLVLHPGGRVSLGSASAALVLSAD